MAAVTQTPTGAVPFAGTLYNTAPSDTYPTHFAWLGKGGWKSVATKAELALINPERNEGGAACFVLEKAHRGIYIYVDDAWTLWTPNGTSTGGGNTTGTPSSEPQLVYTASLPALPTAVPDDYATGALITIDKDDGSVDLYQVRDSNGSRSFYKIPVNGPAASTGPACVVPPGGLQGQYLVKKTGTDFDLSWQDIPVDTSANLPVGGRPGQHLVIADNGTNAATWSDVSVPQNLVELNDVDTVDMLTKSGYFLAVNDSGNGFVLRQGANARNLEYSFNVDNTTFQLVYNLGHHMNTSIAAHLECKAEGDLELQYVSPMGSVLTETVDGALMRYIPARDINIKLYAKGKGKILIDILSFAGLDNGSID